jgi:hypothetical protein
LLLVHQRQQHLRRQRSSIQVRLGAAAPAAGFGGRDAVPWGARG